MFKINFIQRLWQLCNCLRSMILPIFYGERNYRCNIISLQIVPISHMMITILYIYAYPDIPYMHTIPTTKRNCCLGKVFFHLACRIILGPPKHVLHLVWSCLDINPAIKTALKVSLNSYLAPISLTKSAAFHGGAAGRKND